MIPGFPPPRKEEQRTGVKRTACLGARDVLRRSGSDDGGRITPLVTGAIR